MRTRRVGVVLKTSSGGMWILPQVEALRAKAEVVVFIPRGDGRLSRRLDALALEDKGLKVHRTDYRFGFIPRMSNVRDFMRFARDLRAQDLDGVLYHLYASTLAARFALMGTRARRVQMVAGPLHLESALIRAAERVLSHLDTVIIGGSEHIRKLYVDLGVRPQKLAAIPYGVDTETFRPATMATRQRVREELGVSPDAFLVVMVAFVYPPKRLVHAGKGIKGHAELLEAWASFSRHHPEARLLIVGGGFQQAGEDYRSHVIESAPAALESMGVTWYDTVEDVRGLYGAADLSVSPSLSENHGAALEASAMGVPSIVSDAGGLPETIEPGASGWLVAAGDVPTLAEALESAHAAWSDGSLPNMGRRARELAVERFDSAEAGKAVAAVVLEGIV